MKKIFCLGVLVLLSFQVLAEHQIEYRISPLGNLVYQLDCLAKVSRFSCSRPDYQALWQEEIQADEQDAEQLERWYQLRNKLDEKVTFKEVPQNQLVTSANYPVNTNNRLNVLEQIRIMAFAAGSQKAYYNLVGLLLSPNHVDQEMKVLAHFWPRFEPWFKLKKPELLVFVGEAEVLSEQVNINGLLSAMRTFYHAQLPINLTLPVYLVAHPKAQANSSGLAFQQSSIIEVLKGEKAADRLAIVMHEIAHFYHEQAPFEHHVELMNFFTNPASKTGKVGYYLFNEALASAIGNGILEKRLRKADSWERYLNFSMSFYADQGIDISSKAAMGLVQPLLTNNQTMDKAFLTALDERWAISLRDIKDTPKQRFRHVGMVNLTGDGEGMGDELINQMFDLLRPSSAQVSDDADVTSDDFILNRYPKLDVLILAKTWGQLIPLNLAGLVIPKEANQGMQILTTPEGTKHIVIVSPSATYIVNTVRDLLNKTSF